VVNILLEDIQRIDESCFIHPRSVVAGKVLIGEDSSVWPFCSIRGDEEEITLGRRTNVQDGVVIHADPGFPTRIGDEVTIGHRAVLHGCTVEDRCIIGIGSILLNGCRIRMGSMIGAGAVIPPGMDVPEGSMVLGVPGEVKRSSPHFEEMAVENARIYVEAARSYLEGYGSNYDGSSPPEHERVR